MLDREVGTLIGTAGPVSPRLFTYVRYNAELTDKGLAALGVRGVEPRHVQMLDSIEHLSDLKRVGRAVAETKVSADHFKGFLA
jgi:hypothetical protein